MKINKKLLPMKAHYFFINAGSAPIFPFMPVILKDLGFSAMSVGWIFTAYPLLTIFCKPLFGTFADKFRCHRFLFIFLLFFHLITMFGIQWTPHLPYITTAELTCGEGDLGLRICSDKLSDPNYIKKIGKLINYTVTCKIGTENLKKIFGDTTSTNLITSFDDQEVTIKLGPRHLFKGHCLVTTISHYSIGNSVYAQQCERNTSVLSSVLCEDPTIMDFIKKPSIAEHKQAWTHQFWIAFFLFISVRIAGSTLQSFSDAFCFALLGDKPENYGTQRMWGAVSWGLISLLNGLLVDKMSRGMAEKNFLPSYYSCLVLLLTDVIIALNIKATFKKRSINVMKDVKKLLMQIRICLFIFWCFICGIFVAIIWSFLFWFIEDLASRNPDFDMKWIKTLEGLVLTVHCYFGEIPFFFFSGWILRKIGHPKTMVIVLFFYGVRFLLYSSVNDPWWILPVETINGITFGLFYTTMVSYASSIAPAGTEATVQNLVGTVFEGAGKSIGSLLGAYLFKKLGSSKALFILGSSALGLSFLYVLLLPKLVTEKNNTGLAKETMDNKGETIEDKENNVEELKKLTTSPS